MGFARQITIERYQEGTNVVDLQGQILVWEETLLLESFALYEPKFKLTTSQEYKTRLDYVRDRQKILIKNGQAATGNMNLTVNNSQVQGRKLVNDMIKLVIRSFNNEADACVANVKFDLEPMDRVDELGDASVPFWFDVHAMVFSNNAPALEAKLHEHFASGRLNKINGRKEFFRAEIAEIEKVIRENYDAVVEVTHEAPAEQYRESLRMALPKPAIQQSERMAAQS